MLQTYENIKICLKATLILATITCVFACTSATNLSIKDQQAIQTSFQKKTYYLKYPVFIGTFFEYNDRWLLSERGFDERVLIETPSGKPILPPKSTDILPMGTKVIIREIEFPTSSVLLSRKLMSPRHFTWVMLDLENKPQSKPYLLVLTQQMKENRDFKKAITHYLVTEDPRKEFAGAPIDLLQAINNKTIIKGMISKALLRSRGMPNKRSRIYKDQAMIETWQYAPNRLVYLKNDQVEKWEGFTFPDSN